jgi:hypothetical protein
MVQIHRRRNCLAETCTEDEANVNPIAKPEAAPINYGLGKGLGGLFPRSRPVEEASAEA